MEEKYRINIARTGMKVASIALVIKALSFLKDAIIASNLGATALSDAFYVSIELLMLFSTFIRSPFSAAYLPIATDEFFVCDKYEKKSFFGSIYGAMFAIGVLIMVVEFGALDWIIRFSVPGFSTETKALLRILMILQLPIVPLSMVGAVNDGNLRLLNKFGSLEISNSIIPLIYIMYFVLFRNSITPKGLAYCAVGAYLATFIFKYLIIVNNGINYKWKATWWRTQTIKPIWKAMIPFLLATSVKEINSFVDKLVASLLDEGSITIQTYASKITLTEVGIIATAISMVVFSVASKQNTGDDLEGLKKTLIEGMSFICTLIIPMCVLTIVFSKDIIQVLFGRGEFSVENVKVTALTMSIYAVGMLGAGIEDVLTRIMHATKHRKYPAIISSISVLANTGLNLLLYKQWGVYGLAFATSLVMLLKIPAYMIYTDKRIIKIGINDGIYQEILKILMISVVSGMVVYELRELIDKYWGLPLYVLLALGTFGCFLCFSGLVIIKNKYAISIVQKMKGIMR